MGFWDVLLFCIATVLGPRWIAAAARNGQSSISLWILAARAVFCSDGVRGGGAFDAISGRGRAVRLDENGVRGFSRIRGGMDVLDLHRFLFPGTFAGERGDDCVRRRQQNRMAGGEPNVSARRIVRDADCGRVAEHYWLAHRQVAAECGWRGHVYSAADDCCGGAVAVGTAGIGDALHAGRDASALGLGHREFLVADRVCIYRARTRFRDERGSAGPAAHVSEGDLCFRGADRRHLHRGDDRDPDDDSAPMWWTRRAESFRRLRPARLLCESELWE